MPYSFFYAKLFVAKIKRLLLSTSVEMPEGSFTRPISEADFALS